ncbi:hypothetical protein Gpo141_00013913 [Globisporangium polare]
MGSSSCQLGDEGEHCGRELVSPGTHLAQPAIRWQSQESTCSARNLVADAFFDRQSGAVATCAAGAAIQVEAPAPLADKAAATSADPIKVKKARTPKMTIKQKEDVFFWIFDAHLCVKDAAALAFIDSPSALKQAAWRGEAKYRALVAARTADEIVRVEHKLDAIIKALESRALLAGRMPPGCNTLKFPEKNDPVHKGHQQRLLKKIQDAKRSIDVEIYTRCEIASALIRRHQQQPGQRAFKSSGTVYISPSPGHTSSGACFKQEDKFLSLPFEHVNQNTACKSCAKGLAEFENNGSCSEWR